VLSVEVDELPPTASDVGQLLEQRRAKTYLSSSAWHTAQLITIYEALPGLVEFSGLAYLFLRNLGSMDTCIQTRCGRLRPQLTQAFCPTCHLYKAHRFCGRVSGLSEGLLLWTKEIATALAVVRAAKVLAQVREQCLADRGKALRQAQLQQLLGCKVEGRELYEGFRRVYLSRLRVTAMDVKAAFVLVAPYHVWVDSDWFAKQTAFEGNFSFLFQEVADNALNSMVCFLKENQVLVGRLAQNHPISSTELNGVENYLTTQDASMLGVFHALRDAELPIQFQEDLRNKNAS